LTVSVLIPYRPDGGERDRIFAWMQKRWQALFPNWDLVVSDDLGGEQFNKGQAWNLAANYAIGEIFVCTEHELAFNRQDLLDAVETVKGQGGWLLPERYYMLDREHTDHLLAEPPEINIGIPVHPLYAWYAESPAPIHVLRRDVFELVNGYDEHFPGWGHVDRAFVAAVDTLYMSHQRFRGSVFHMDHARPKSVDCNPALSRRYQQANGKRSAMRALIHGR
jgi:hypothetical protein